MALLVFASLTPTVDGPPQVGGPFLPAPAGRAAGRDAGQDFTVAGATVRVLSVARSRHAPRPPPLRTLGLLLALALAACGSAHRDRGFDLGSVVSGRVAFRCDDNRRFTVAFEQGGRYATASARRTAATTCGRGRPEPSSYHSDDGVAQLDLNGDRAHLQIKNGRD